MSVTYYTRSGQSAFTVATTIGLPVWETPFPESTERLVFSQRFMQLAANYTPITPNTAYPAHGQYGVPTSSSYYLVGEDSFADERGGLLTWRRTYAAVPVTRYEYTSIAYQYPAAISLPVVTGGYSWVDVVSFGYGGVDRAYVANSGYATFNIGEYAAISYRVVISGSTVQMNNLVMVRDVSLNGGAIVDLPPNFFDATVTARAMTRVVRTGGRSKAETLPGRAVIAYSYAMVTPGVTPNFTFASRQKFLLGGEEVDYVSTATTPSITVYGGWVSSGEFMQAEDETWARWLGNIYERRSVRVVAL